MTGGEAAALSALSLRVTHVAATANLLSDALTARPHNDVIAGIAATLEELSARLDALADQTDA